MGSDVARSLRNEEECGSLNDLGNVDDFILSGPHPDAIGKPHGCEIDLPFHKKNGGDAIRASLKQGQIHSVLLIKSLLIGDVISGELSLRGPLRYERCLLKGGPFCINKRRAKEEREDPEENAIY
jgi:hypothetical protein